jgi:Putative MetA-pathway of phenol degradation
VTAGIPARKRSPSRTPPQYRPPRHTKDEIRDRAWVRPTAEAHVVSNRHISATGPRKKRRANASYVDFAQSCGADWGCRNTSPDSTCLGVDIPVIEWATSWKILGGRLQFVVATPVVEVGVHHTNYLRGVYNPLFAGMLAWDLGNGFGVSYLVSAYADVKTEVAWSSSSLNQRFALSYTGYGWDLTANVIWGIQRDSVSDRPQLSPCPAQFVLNGCNPNFLNVDLTATKKFGKWEFGPVAYYSTDLNSPVVGYQKQSQTAVGALLGYNFGPVILQSYLTREVSERNYGGLDTRLWTRVIIPLVVEQPAPTRAARVRGS